MKRILTATAALIGFSAPVAAGEFAVIFASDDFFTVADVGSVEKQSDGMVRFWRYLQRRDAPAGEYFAALIEADCDKKRQRMVASLLKSRDGTVHDISAPNDWRYALPDTNVYLEYEFVCLGKTNGPPIVASSAGSVIKDINKGLYQR